MTNIRTELTQWLQTEFALEHESGFPRLRRVPDTKVIRFLDHFATLDSAEQSALVAILVEWSSHNLLGTLSPNPTFEQFTLATTFPGRISGLRYTGLNLLAGLAKERRDSSLTAFFQAQGITGLALVPPEGLVRGIADLVPMKTVALRRLVNATLAALFAPQVTNMGSETWRYEGLLDGSLLKLDIRFSNRMGRPQLSYNATVRGKGTVQGKGSAIVLPNLSFESALGVGFGQWNYLTVENAERSIALLAELVVWLAQLPERLPVVFYQMPTK